ncbi:hypothetical protein M9Y10_001848 [Tritrichomonas musculus]|uniref:Thioredoxin domain-containing protein n=1 Tax=Tritrichomonas musculus TaxID=1915356 RepID=A0ABR2L8I1_9EUKA
MLMLLLLVLPCYSNITDLNDQNYEEILNRKGKNPLFLKVWSPWCSHCRLLAPIFQKISELDEFDSKIEFGEFNCDLFPSQCKKISDNKVPTFFYYDNDSTERIQYANDFSFDAFIFFLKKQLNKYLINITNEKEREEILSASDYAVSYIFTLPLNDPSLELVANLSNRYKGSNKRFFIESNSSITEKSLVAYLSHNYYVKYDGNWSSSSIHDFIFENYSPLIENAGSEVFMISSFFEKRIVLFGLKDMNARSEINKWNLDPRPDVQYCVEDLQHDSGMAYKTLFNINTKKQFIAVIDFKNRIVWQKQSTQFNKDEVNELINLSFADKNYKYASGPGNPNNSLFQKFLYFFINQFGQDWKLYMFLGVILLFAALAIISLLVLICLENKNKKNKKKNV